MANGNWKNLATVTLGNALGAGLEGAVITISTRPTPKAAAPKVRKTEKAPKVRKAPKAKSDRIHGLMVNLESQQKEGRYDHSAVVKRVARAAGVLSKYDIFDLGSKVNGWKEKVHAYRVVSPEGREHEVQVRDNGMASCNCHDWIYRRKANAGLCKHVIAVKALHE